MPSATIPGLTATEVQERIARGQVNRTPRTAWREYTALVVRNLCTLFNLMVVPAAIALFSLGEPQGGIAVSGMAFVNTLLALVQEIKAKRHLDRLAILVETTAKVWRDGSLQVIPASAVVRDECIQIGAGDAIIADGTVIAAQALEVDEALLTGESDPVLRHQGEAVLSGSFCVAGEGVYRADKVGSEAFAQSTAAEARRFQYMASPLTRQINILIQVLSGITLLLAGVYCLLSWTLHYEQAELVKMIAATITSMVPQGLVLTATVSFTLGAIAMSQRGAIVQRLNAVETMASVDVICTDKTGTLTTNQLTLDRLRPLTTAMPEAEIRRRLQLFVGATLDRQNKTIAALEQALGPLAAPVLAQLPFKSQNRYSAVRLRDGEQVRLLVLGACDALAERCREAGWRAVWDELQPHGLRLLLFAEAEHDVALDNVTALPTVALQPLAIVAFSDELRPEAQQVLEALAAQGIAFKVISGDHPETVHATVSHVQLPWTREPVVTGAELASAADPAQLIDTHSIFGRVSPRQKVDIVAALQQRGRCVAMIGDGVNDVLPIKRADLGIAMGAGSQASKTVAGLVLANNDFALLPETLEEGRVILRNLCRSGKIILAKNVYSLLFILAYAVQFLGVPFPYIPQQVTLLNWLVIGVPAFVIAFSRERSATAIKPTYLREVGSFALRTGVLFAAAGLTVLLLAVHVWRVNEQTQRTLLLTTLILLGITSLLRALHDGDGTPLRSDVRFRWLAALVVPVYLLAMYWPFAARFFELAQLSLLQWGAVLLIALPTWGLTLWSDRWKLTG